MMRTTIGPNRPELSNTRRQLLGAVTLPDAGPQIESPLCVKAQVELSISRQSCSRARLAEWRGHGGDDSKHRSIAASVSFCGAEALISDHFYRTEIGLNYLKHFMLADE